MLNLLKGEILVMYINDVHILVYCVAGILGAIVGAFINWCNIRLPEEKNIFSKDMLKKSNRGKTNYILMATMAAIYVVLVYFLGIHEGFYDNLNLIKYAVLIPMLLSALVIDYKLQIIPNRLNLTMFEIGLLLSFIYGTINVNIAIDMLLRNGYRSWNIFSNNITWWTYCRKRSNGLWRC